MDEAKTLILVLSERALLVHKITRILFITEYLVLMEYTEVVLPVIYCTFAMMSVCIP
jgi:hypothetical protein